MSFPPSAVDVTCEKAEHCIPPSWHNFLSWLIVGDKGKPQVESLTVEERLHLQKKSDQRLVMSIAQDIIYAATHGRVKTPKHVALPLAVKQMTGSAKTITLLNRFGHGLALTQLREVEAGMAEKMMEQQDGVFVPTNISKGKGFVHFCWDNNDINEETPSGSGTTHCTNGIIIQRKVQPTSVTSIDDGQYSSWRRGCNRRRRSTKPPLPLSLEYVAGRREGPQIKALQDDVLAQLDRSCKQPLISLKKEDFAWLLARLRETKGVTYCEGG